MIGNLVKWVVFLAILAMGWGTTAKIIDCLRYAIAQGDIVYGGVKFLFMIFIAIVGAMGSPVGAWLLGDWVQTSVDPIR